MELVISRLRNITESSEGWICIIKREDKPQKGAQSFRRMTYLEDSIQKDDYQKYVSHEVSHSKHLQHDSWIEFKKSKLM